METGKKMSKAELEEKLEERDLTGITLDFSGRDFSTINLNGLHLNRLDFSLAKFQEAKLRNTTFIDSNLSGADFGPLPDSSLHTVLVEAIFEGACLQGANFYKAHLLKANLSKARLDPWNDQGRKIPTILSEADLSQAVLRGTDLTAANLQGAKLKGADLTGANLQSTILDGVDFTGATLADTKMSRDSLGGKILQEEKNQFEEARLIYLALKKNFQDLGANDDASWAYVKQRTMGRKMSSPVWAWRIYRERKKPKKDLNLFQEVLWNVKFIVKYVILWIMDTLIWIFTGYGERPEHAVYLSITSIFFFTLIFRLAGGLEIECSPLPCTTPLHVGLKDYFLHSLGSFTTMPYLNPTTALSRILTSLEAVTGVTSLAVFTSALSQRIGSR